MRHSSFQSARARSNSGSSRGSSPVPRPAIRQPVRSFSPPSEDDIVIPKEPTQEEAERPILRQPTAFAWTGPSTVLKDTPAIPTYAEPVIKSATVFLPGQGLQNDSPSGSKNGAAKPSKRKGTKAAKRKASNDVKRGRPRTTRDADPFEQHCFKVAPPGTPTQSNARYPGSLSVAIPNPSQASTIQTFRLAPIPPTAQSTQRPLPIPTTSRIPDPIIIPPAIPSFPQHGNAWEYDSEDIDSDFDSPGPASSSRKTLEGVLANPAISLRSSQPLNNPSRASSHPPAPIRPTPPPKPTERAIDNPPQSTPRVQTQNTVQIQAAQPRPATPGTSSTPVRNPYAQYYPSSHPTQHFHGTFPAYYQPIQSALQAQYQQYSQSHSTPQQTQPRLQHTNGAKYNPTYYKRVYEDDVLNPGKPAQQPYRASSQSSSQRGTSTGPSERYPTPPHSSAYRSQSIADGKRREPPVAKKKAATQQSSRPKATQPVSAPPDGSVLRVVTLLLKDLRLASEDDDGELQLIEIQVPIREMDDKEGFWADSKDICQKLQSGPARVDGPAKVYTMRQQYKQILLRVSENNQDVFMSANIMVSPTRTVELFVQDIAPPRGKTKPKQSQSQLRLVDSDPDDRMETASTARGLKRKKRGGLSSDGSGSPKRRSSRDASSKKPRHSSPVPPLSRKNSSPSLTIMEGIEELTPPHVEDIDQLVCKVIQSGVSRSSGYSNLSWDDFSKDNILQLIERCKFVNSCVKQWCGQKNLSNIPGLKDDFLVTKEHVYKALKLDQDWIEYFEKTWPLYVAQAGAGSRLGDVDGSKFVDQRPMDRLFSVLQEADKMRREAAPTS